MSAAADGGTAYVIEHVEGLDGTVKRRVRAKTVSVKRLSKRDLAAGAAEYPASINAEYERPQTREDCLPGGCNEARPCPFVSCKFNVYLDVNERTGSIKFNFPELGPEDVVRSCALDIADEGPHTLEEVGDLTRRTRERIRQIEQRSFAVMRGEAEALELDDFSDDNARTYAPAVGVRNTGEGR